MATKQRQTIIAKCYDKKGNLLSVGFNSYKKTHPLQALLAAKVGHPYKIYLHAEISAILRAGDKSIHAITVERYNADGLPVNATPCPICALAIKIFNVKKVSHT